MIVVASYAAVVGTISLIVSILVYRAGTPKLRPSTHLRSADEQGAAELRIAVKNVGRAVGEVVSIELDVPGPHTINLGGEGDPKLYGPTLPESIPPHSTRSWVVSAPELVAVTNRHAWQHVVRAVIADGAYNRIWESIHKYTNLVSG